jgi:hypothetical protein
VTVDLIQNFGILGIGSLKDRESIDSYHRYVKSGCTFLGRCVVKRRGHMEETRV